jgi:hypothetical protein
MSTDQKNLTKVVSELLNLALIIYFIVMVFSLIMGGINLIEEQTLLIVNLCYLNYINIPYPYSLQ